MNLYHKKQRWKIALLAFAILMVGLSLWFSWSIVDKVQDREVDRVQQWADAVKRKSELVNLTNHAFDELSSAISKLQEKEHQKVEMWSYAIEEMNRLDPSDNFDFVLKILRANSTIPMIMTDMEDNIVSSYNLQMIDSAIVRSVRERHPDAGRSFQDSVYKAAKQDSLTQYVREWQLNREPLEIDLFYGEKQKVIYFDSIALRTEKLIALQYSRDSLVKAFGDELITNEYLVPVLFINRSTRQVLATNMPEYDSTNTGELVSRLAASNDSILVDLGNNNNGVIYYEHSPELTQMKYFPLVQFLIIGLFMLIAYLVFSTFRKAEQDQVWVGMAKETAHQLGTPISSLMAWNEILKSQGVEESITSEVDKDIDRLNTVTNRFSKIGSEAELQLHNVTEVVQQSVDYLRSRISSKVELNFSDHAKNSDAMINPPLLEWVIENITKNAVDSMEGQGMISVEISRSENEIHIDISDTGKGIPANKIKTVFQPGYTTKKRGWGLGLSLVKRIVEDFHRGKVFVLRSEINQGTTFRISLRG